MNGTEGMGTIAETSKLQLVQPGYTTRDVLIVGPERGSQVEAALTERGWRVATCPGPGNTDCPLMRGGSCEPRADVDVAIVHVDLARGSMSGNLLARVRCAASGRSSTLFALEGRFDRGRIEGTTGTIGAARSAQEIVETVEELHARMDP